MLRVLDDGLCLSEEISAQLPAQIVPSDKEHHSAQEHRDQRLILCHTYN